MGLRNFHVQEFDGEAPTTVGTFRHEVLRLKGGLSAIEQTRKRTVSKDGTHSTASLEIRAGHLEILISPEGAFAKGTNVVLLNDGSLDRIGREVEGRLEEEPIPFKDRVDDQYILGIETTGPFPLAQTKPDRLYLAYSILSAACFGITAERTGTITRLYEKIEEDANRLSLFQEHVTPMSSVLDEVARVLQLDPQTGSIILVRSKNLVYGLDKLLDTVLRDKIIEPGEKEEVLGYLRNTVSPAEVKENTPLAIALSEVVITRIRNMYQDETQRRRINSFLERLDEKVRDRVLTLEELAAVDFELSRVDEQDPVKMALELVKELKFHGVENRLTDLNLPGWAEDALLLVYKLEYMSPSDATTRVRLLRTYDSMEGSKDIPLSKRYILQEHLTQRTHDKTTEWNNEIERERGLIETELGRPYTRNQKDIDDLRAREHYELATTCERAQCSLLKEVTEDILDLALARGHLVGYNQFNGGYINPRNPNKLMDLIRVKKRLDALDPRLFDELVMGHVRDEKGRYINPGCVQLEEKLKDVEAFETLLKDPVSGPAFIDQLNQIPENKYTGKRISLQLERPFRVLGVSERAERAYRLTEMVLGISRVHGMGDEWEGLSREEFNEQFSRGVYSVGSLYSINSDGAIRMNPEGASEDTRKRIGVAVAVLESVLKGDQDIKFRFLD